MPVLPSYRNQSIWTVNQLTGFYIRATLAFNKFNFLTGNGITYCFDSFIPRFSFTLHRRFSDRFSACSEESKMYKSKEAFYTKVEKHLFKKKQKTKNMPNSPGFCDVIIVAFCWNHTYTQRAPDPLKSGK